MARASQTLDLSEPVAILLLAVLHFLADDDDPWAIVTRLLDGITGDAYLVIAHAADDRNPAEASDAVAGTTSGLQSRSLCAAARR